VVAVKTDLPRSPGDAGIGSQKALAALLLILFAAGFCSVLHALSQPFWFDEMCTLIVCRLPSASQVWKALANGADTNPLFII
jgi:hypothetical protein